jgi:hypothetical protein
MSDHDRGAYTPQTDEPLAFDARRPGERRPVPVTLIGSAVVLALLIGGVALVYRGGVRGKDEGPRPVGQPVMSVKTAPALVAETASNAATTSSQTDVSTQSKPEPVTLGANQTGEAPTFAAAPEQPAARPKPSPSTIAMMAPPKPAAQPVSPPAHVAVKSAAETSSRLDPSLVEAAGMTRASDQAPTIRLAQASKPRHVANTVSEEDDAVGGASQATPTKSAPAKISTSKATSVKTALGATPAPAQPAGKAAPAGSAVVQIGAFSSTALADTGYADVSAALSGRMAGKSKHVLAVDKDGKTLFRTWVAGFATRADAVSFCEALKAKNKSCIVKG